MPSHDELLPALTRRYGRPAPADPGEETFPRLVGTLLETLLDASRRVRALSALREAGLLEPQPLAEADAAEIVEVLRSAGITTNEKALAPLGRFARWLVERRRGDVDSLDDLPTSLAREELSEIRGIGPATADALLLFGLRRAAYPVDRASYRIALRHGWIDPGSAYDEASEALRRLAPDDPAALERLARWFERVGRDYCRASAAKCEGCPLAPWLPATGPLEPDA